MQEKGSIAIITARGGSKRIPGKNIRDFCGKPVISYSIEAALKSGIFETVMVSTDSSQIAGIAEQYGAEIPFMRSAVASDDYATTSDVLLEVLREYEKRQIKYKYACCIYPTTPLLTAEKLRTAMQELKMGGVDTVIPVVAYSYPPQRGMIIADGLVKLKHEEYKNTRTQDLEKIYHDCGQFYAFDVERFKCTQNLLTGRIKPIICMESEIQDIDTLEDWKVAETKYMANVTRRNQDGYLRPADLEDCDLLFQWANETEVRRNSFHTEPISYEEHVEWYGKQLQRSDTRQYIYIRESEPVGQIRITESREKVEIAYSVVTDKRGRGYGKHMLQLIRDKIKQEFPQAKVAIAKVKPDNIASRRAFEQTGFYKKYDAYELLLDDIKEK